MKIFLLINAILFLIAAVSTIIERIKFEKSKEDEDQRYVVLFRDHSNLKIVFFSLLFITLLCSFFGI